MRAHPRHFRPLSVLLALAAFTFMFLRLDSRPPYQWVDLYANLSLTCIIGSILSLVTCHLWPLPRLSLKSSSASPSTARTSARLFCLAAYLLSSTGILLIGLYINSRSSDSTMLGELALASLLAGLVTAMAAKICDVQADRKARTQPTANDQEHRHPPL